MRRSRRSRTPGRPRSTKLILATLLLAAIGLSGCAGSHASKASPYSPEIRSPKHLSVYECTFGSDDLPRACVVVPLEYFDYLTVELEAACVALGHDKKDCEVY